MEIRRRFDEILARYKLEPSLKDVYVEGMHDLCFLRWFLDKEGKTDVQVYQIQTVEIPEAMFKHSGRRQNSNRDQVILLSEALANHVGDLNLRARCVADADYDRYLNRCGCNPFLLYTDFTSMEMYLFSESCIRKTINFTAPSFPLQAKALLGQLSKALQDLFVIRLTNENLDWGMHDINIKDYTKWRGKQVIFESSRYMCNYLIKNGKVKKESDEFKETLHSLRNRFVNEARHNIRGHDFTYLLFLTLKREGGHRFGFRDIETFERSIAGFAEIADLKDYNLFLTLDAM